jgi:hypothetical protein
MNSHYAAFQITERRCKICTSPLRGEIDRLLLGDERRDDGGLYRQIDVIAWASQRGLELSPAGLSRHYHGHVQPSVNAMLEVESQMKALQEVTGKKLSLPRVFANVVLSKMMRYLDNLSDERLDEADPIKALRMATEVARTAMHIERAEFLLTKEEVAERITEGLAGRGMTQETIDMVQREILGMR